MRGHILSEVVLTLAVGLTHSSGDDAVAPPLLAWSRAVGRGGLGTFRAGILRLDHGTGAATEPGAAPGRHRAAGTGTVRDLDARRVPDPADGRVRERSRCTRGPAHRKPHGPVVRCRADHRAGHPAPDRPA